MQTRKGQLEVTISPDIYTYMGCARGASGPVLELSSSALHGCATAAEGLLCCLSSSTGGGSSGLLTVAAKAEVMAVAAGAMQRSRQR